MTTSLTKMLTHRTVYLFAAGLLAFSNKMPFAFFCVLMLLLVSLIIDAAEWKQTKKSEISRRGGLYIILSIFTGHYFFLFGIFFAVAAFYNWLAAD